MLAAEPVPRFHCVAASSPGPLRVRELQEHRGEHGGTLSRLVRNRDGDLAPILGHLLAARFVRSTARNPIGIHTRVRNESFGLQLNPEA